MKLSVFIFILSGVITSTMAQDYIKPLRFDTVPCKILQEDSLWIYYQTKPQSKVRRYKKSDVELYSYFGHLTVLQTKPTSAYLQPKIKTRPHLTGSDSIIAVADKFHNQANAMLTGSVILGTIGYTGMTIGLLGVLLEGSLATFVNSTLIVVTSFILNMSADSKKYKANKMLYQSSPAQTSTNPIGKITADSTSR
ncbi:MAG: hypothetical protein WC760_11720 [Bacteroidia bacterium]|jgi:hypothetical protein